MSKPTDNQEGDADYIAPEDIKSFADLSSRNSLMLYNTLAKRGKFTQRATSKTAPIGLSCVKPIKYIKIIGDNIFIQNASEFQKIKFKSTENFRNQIIIEDIHQLIGDFKCCERVGGYVLAFEKSHGQYYWGKDPIDTFNFFKTDEEVKSLSGSDIGHFFVATDKTIFEVQSESHREMDNLRSSEMVHDKWSEQRFLTAPNNQVFHNILYREKLELENIPIIGKAGPKPELTQKATVNNLISNIKDHNKENNDETDRLTGPKNEKENLLVNKGKCIRKLNVSRCTMIIEIELKDVKSLMSDKDKKKLEEAEKEKKEEEEQVQKALNEGKAKLIHGLGNMKVKDKMGKSKGLGFLAKVVKENEKKVENGENVEDKKENNEENDSDEKGILEKKEEKPKDDIFDDLMNDVDEGEVGIKNIESKQPTEIFDESKLPKRRFAIFHGEKYVKGVRKSIPNKKDLSKYITIEDEETTKRTITTTLLDKEGKFFYIGFSNGEIECWQVDLLSGPRLIHKSDLHDGKSINFIICNKEAGNVIVSVGDSSKIVITNHTGSNVIKEFNECHKSNEGAYQKILSIDFSDNGESIVSTNSNNELRFHSLNGAAELIKWEWPGKYDNQINNLFPLYSRQTQGQEFDQKIIIMGKETPETYSWTKKEKMPFDESKQKKVPEEVRYCALSKDDRYLAVGQDNGSISFYDMDNQEEQLTHYISGKKNYEYSIFQIVWSLDHLCFMVCDTGTVVCYNQNSRKQIKTTDSIERRVEILQKFKIDNVVVYGSSIHVTKCGGYFLVGGKKDVVIYDVNTPEVVWKTLPNIHATNQYSDCVMNIYVKSKQFMFTTGNYAPYFKAWDVTRVFDPSKKKLALTEEKFPKNPEELDQQDDDEDDIDRLMKKDDDEVDFEKLIIPSELEINEEPEKMCLNKNEDLLCLLSKGNCHIYEIDDITNPKNWSVKLFLGVDPLDNLSDIKEFVFHDTDSGTNFFTMDSGSNVREYSLNGFAELKKLNMPHKKRIMSIILTRDNKYIISGGQDNEIKFWSCETKEIVHTVKHASGGQLADMNYMAIGNKASNLNYQVIVASCSGMIKIYECLNNLARSDATAVYEENLSKDIIKIATMNEIDFNSAKIAVAHGTSYNQQGSITIIDGSKANLLELKKLQADKAYKSTKLVHNRLIPGPEGQNKCNCVEVCFRDKLLYAAYEKGFVKVFNNSNYSEVTTYKNLFTTGLFCMTLSPNGYYMALGSAKDLKIYETQKRELYCEFKDIHTDALKDISFTNDNKYLATCSADMQICIIDPDMKTIVQKFKDVHSETINRVRYSHDGQFLVSCSDDRCIKVLDIGSSLILEQMNLYEKHFTKMRKANETWMAVTDTHQITVGYCDAKILKIDNKESIENIAWGVQQTYKEIHPLGTENSNQITLLAVKHPPPFNNVQLQKGTFNLTGECQTVMASYSQDGIKFHNYITGEKLDEVKFDNSTQENMVEHMQFNCNGVYLVTTHNSIRGTPGIGGEAPMQEIRVWSAKLVEMKSKRDLAKKKKEHEESKKKKKEQKNSDAEEQEQLKPEIDTKRLITEANEEEIRERLVATFKFENKITAIKFHPLLPNVLAVCSDNNHALRVINVEIDSEKFKENEGVVVNDVDIQDAERGDDDDTSERIIEYHEIEFWKKHHQNKITSVDWSPDGRYLITGSADKTIKQIAVKPNLLEGKKFIESTLFSSGCKPDNLSHNKLEVVETYKGDGKFDIMGVAFSSDSKFFGAVTYGKTVIVYYADTREELFRTNDVVSAYADNIMFSPCRRYLFIGSRKSELVVIGLDNYFHKGRVMLKLAMDESPPAWSMSYFNPLRNYSFFTYKLWQEFLFKGIEIKIDQFMDIKENMEIAVSDKMNIAITELDILCQIAFYVYKELDLYIPNLLKCIASNPNRPDFDNMYPEVVDYINKADDDNIGNCLHYLMKNMNKPVENMKLGNQPLIKSKAINYEYDEIVQTDPVYNPNKKLPDKVRYFMKTFKLDKTETSFIPIEVTRTTYDIDFDNPSEVLYDLLKTLTLPQVVSETQVDEIFKQTVNQFWRIYKKQLMIIFFFYTILVGLIYTQGFWINDNNVSSEFSDVWNYIILGLAGFLTLYEIQQVIATGISYLASYQNIIDFITFGLIYANSIMQIRVGYNPGSDYDNTFRISWYVTTLFFAVVKLYLNFNIISLIAKLSTKLFDIIGDIFVFLCFLAIWVVIFASLFYASRWNSSMESDVESRTYGYYLLWTYDMQYAGWNRGEPVENALLWIYSFWIIFTIVFPIILFNLIIALLTTSYENTKQKEDSGDSQRKLESILEVMDSKQLFGKQKCIKRKQKNNKLLDEESYKPLIRYIGTELEDMFEPYVPRDLRKRTGKFLYLIKDTSANMNISEEITTDSKLVELVDNSNKSNTIMDFVKSDINDLGERAQKIESIELNCSQVVDRFLKVKKALDGKLGKMETDLKDITIARDEWKDKYEKEKARKEKAEEEKAEAENVEE